MGIQSAELEPKEFSEYLAPVSNCDGVVLIGVMTFIEICINESRILKYVHPKHLNFPEELPGKMLDFTMRMFDD